MKTLLHATVVIAIIGGLALPANCQQGTNAEASVRALQPGVLFMISGDAAVKSMTLNTNGVFYWYLYLLHGGHATDFSLKGQLGTKDFLMVLALALRAQDSILQDEYVGGAYTYTLIMLDRHGQEKKIRIRHANEDKKDNRPQELKAFLDALWSTSTRKDSPQP